MRFQKMSILSDFNQKKIAFLNKKQNFLVIIWQIH